MGLRADLLRLKATYLDKARDLGGTKDGYQEFVVDYFGAHPEKWNPDAALREAANRAWDKKATPSPDKDLFSIAGVEMPGEFTYPDAGHEGQYKKIALKYATIGHAREDAILTLRNGATITSAGEAKMKWVDEAMRRAGGDISKSLSQIAD